MEYSEIFLLTWAMLATVIAIAFHHIAKKQRMAILLQQMGFIMIGEGKAKVVIEGDKVQVRSV
jgi:hypothetical protein